MEVLENPVYHSRCHCETVFPLIKLDTLCVQVACVHLWLHLEDFLFLTVTEIITVISTVFLLAACKLPLRTIKASST